MLIQQTREQILIVLLGVRNCLAVPIHELTSTAWEIMGNDRNPDEKVCVRACDQLDLSSYKVMLGQEVDIFRVGGLVATERLQNSVSSYTVPSFWTCRWHAPWT